MATGGMHTNEVKAVVRELELNGLENTTNAKAVIVGLRTGERSSAGDSGMKESPFPRGTRRGVSASNR